MLTYDIARRFTTKHEMSPSLRFRYFSAVTLPLVSAVRDSEDSDYMSAKFLTDSEFVLAKSNRDRIRFATEVSKARQP